MSGSHTLERANQLAQEYMQGLRPCVEEILVADQDFFLDSLDKYSFTVVSDEENRNKQEPDFGTVLPLSFFNTDIHSIQCIAVHYLHVMGHKKCQAFWKQISVPYHYFRESEIHFLEEMYNQRLFDVISPSIYEDFYQGFLRYEENTKFQPLSKLAIRNKLNTLFSKTPHPELPELLRETHSKLYVSDPLSLNTFRWYAEVFHLLINVSNLREQIESY